MGQKTKATWHININIKLVQNLNSKNKSLLYLITKWQKIYVRGLGKQLCQLQSFGFQRYVSNWLTDWEIWNINVLSIKLWYYNGTYSSSVISEWQHILWVISESSAVNKLKIVYHHNIHYKNLYKHDFLFVK